MKKQIETERKYIIEMPRADELSSLGGIESSEITQIYLADEGGRTHRIRKRAYSDGVVYTENIKTRLSPMSVIEEEGEISEARFLELAADIDPKTAPVIKRRLAVEYMGRVLEIDIYPAWERTAVLEVELEGESQVPALPPCIRVLREVTGQRCYSNHSMAYGFPEEII